MVQNFMEDNNEKPSSTAVKCARNRCNCFNGNNNDSPDDELDFFSDSLFTNSSFSDPSDTLKSLTPCATVVERNLLADTSKIIEKTTKLLSHVIMVLVDVAHGKPRHVPYRDSRLTFLLQLCT